MLIRYFILILFLGATLMPSILFADEVDTMRTRFLLLDSRIVASAENAKLVPGTVKKHPNNPLFGEDKPWEKRFDNLYGNIIYDQEEKQYKLWYSPFIVDNSAQGMTLEERKARPYDTPDNREMAICYATSADGINWVKPELGIVEYNGSKATNILWRGNDVIGEHWEGPHGAGVFKDHYDPNAERRYKTILKRKILSVAFSGDGINWGPAIACPAADVRGDTHNNAFWAPTLGKYVGITREWGTDGKKGWRQVARVESKDFIEWSKAEVVLEGTDLDHQTYAMPVFFYGGVYLGLLAVHKQSTDRVWTELTWSADTKTWHRVAPGTPLIPNSDNELDYDYGCVYACADPIFLENEIRLYYGGSDWLHFGWRNGFLSLATLRPDGFAGYIQASAEKPAMITTALISYAGQPLRISADINTGGSITVSVLNNAAKEVATTRVTTTVTDGILQFDQPIAEGDLQLKFELQNAQLYSFSFGEE